MLDLPIAERELRVGARAGATYRSRQNIAATALFVFALAYWNLAKLGPWAVTKVFFLLTGLCFLCALFAGLILTADCISSEKREGTLGLLFLTALKPVDVVAGNILATSLKAFYGLLAAFPILGLSLLLGGIEYSEFVRICLTLLSTLIFSLSWSLLVSCLSRKHLNATGRAAFGLILVALILPQFYEAVRKVTAAAPPAWLELLNLFSPTTTLHWASPGWPLRSNTFWWSLLCVNLASSAFLFLCCMVLPRVWKDRAAGDSGRRARSPGARPSPRRVGVRGNPFCWLASRQSQEAAKFLVIAVLLAVLASIVSQFNLSSLVGPGSYVEFAIPLFLWCWVLAALHLILLYKFATLATHRFAEDRRTGALELLMVAPARVGQMLWGHWLALVRQLGGAMLGTLFLHGLIFWAFLTFAGMQERIVGGTSAVLHRLLDALRNDPEDLWHVLVIFAIILGSAVVLVLNWLALGWAGIWIGLRTRRAALAPWITLALVLVPPVVIFVLVVSLGVWMGLPQGNLFYWAWFCIFAAFGLAVSHAVLLSGWCWFQILRHFRTLAGDRFLERRARDFHFVPRLASAAAALVILVLLFYGEEKWRGLRAWHRLERDCAAQGEPLKVRVAVPPLVPDSENFAAGDIFKPLFDYQYDRSGQVLWKEKAARQVLMTLSLTAEERYPWRQNTNEPSGNWALQKPIDLRAWQRFYRTNSTFSSLSTNSSAPAAVRQALSLFAPELAEIEELSHRPLCRFPLHYDEGFTAVWSHLTVLANVADILQVRAVARLELGDVTGARADVAFALRLANATATGSGLYSFHIRQSILLGALQVIWEGLNRQAWHADDLQFFVRELHLDLLRAYPKAVREHITGIADFWERFTPPDEKFLLRLGNFPASASTARLFPTGWKLLNQVRLFRLCDDTLLPILDPATHQAFPSRAAGLGQAIRRARVAFDPVSLAMVPHQNQEFGDAAIYTAHCQASIDQALIACALEEYRQAHGHLPQTLDQLSPAYLNVVPNDVMTGTSLKYRLLSENGFVLYSVGWNEVDDAGQSRADQSTQLQNLREGDWAWQHQRAK
jgi:hypothetical protein